MIVYCNICNSVGIKLNILIFLIKIKSHGLFRYPPEPKPAYFSYGFETLSTMPSRSR